MIRKTIGLAMVFAVQAAMAGTEWPFVYGSQYYRAPTPEREHWAEDLASLKARGFNTVKYWVQWRWSERRQGEYYWKDLDELMDLAATNGLKVVLNLILDVMPEWVERDHPDSLMVLADGSVFHGEAPAHRQLGGHPGPCYSHDAMTACRRNFSRAAFTHFRGHPALLGWDVWNEPERHYRHRVKNDIIPQLCFCRSCERKFKTWLEKRYGDIDRMNRIWGTCYNAFDSVEIPRDPGTVVPFVDWREFQMDVLHADAEWRLNDLREIDPDSNAHLHVVVSCGGFSPTVGVDDFTLARKCDVFGSSMLGSPYPCAEGISAAADRPFYNAEWHINFGMSKMYPRLVTRGHFLSEQLAQLGWGMRGFLYWQYRTECLGLEAPAWGLIRLDGLDNPTMTHAAEFIKAFTPHVADYMASKPEPPVVLIWRGFRNETYNFARYLSHDKYHGSLRQWCETLYQMNVPFRFVDTEALKRNVWPTAKVLILPEAMFLGEYEATAFAAFADQGNVVIAEGNLGAVNADRNRFSSVVPGSGLAERWGVFEAERTAAVHLPALKGGEWKERGTDDLAKAIAQSGATAHRETFDLTFADGKTVGVGGWDFLRMATDKDTETLATFGGLPVIIRRGRIYYAGTQLGAAAATTGNAAALGVLIRRALADVGAKIVVQPNGMHVDRLRDSTGKCRFAVAVNRAGEPLKPELPSGEWIGLFGELPTAPIAGGEAVMFVEK